MLYGLLQTFINKYLIGFCYSVYGVDCCRDTNLAYLVPLIEFSFIELPEEVFNEAGRQIVSITNSFCGIAMIMCLV